jgi:hypothetical protein
VLYTAVCDILVCHKFRRAPYGGGRFFAECKETLLLLCRASGVHHPIAAAYREAIEHDVGVTPGSFAANPDAFLQASYLGCLRAHWYARESRSTAVEWTCGIAWAGIEVGTKPGPIRPHHNLLAAASLRKASPQPPRRSLLVATSSLQPLLRSLLAASLLAASLQLPRCSLLVAASSLQPLVRSLLVAASSLQPLFRSLLAAGLLVKVPAFPGVRP